MGPSLRKEVHDSQEEERGGEGRYPVGVSESFTPPGPLHTLFYYYLYFGCAACRILAS